ncbi:hypothetical protein KBC55_01360 [Patescibacteria group bacterium]|nr:hypothetical protein [Patescibacteria group bacterium]
MERSLDNERGAPLVEDQEVLLEMPEAPEEMVARVDVMNEAEANDFHEAFAEELQMGDDGIEEYEGELEEIDSEVAERFWAEGERMTKEQLMRRLSLAERAAESSQRVLATLDLDSREKAVEAALGLVPMLNFLQGVAGRRIKVDGGVRLEPMKPGERMVAMVSDLMPVPGTGFVLERAYQQAVKRGLDERMHEAANDIGLKVAMQPTVQSLLRAFA